MAEQVTLNLPEALALQMREVATLTQRGMEEVLLEWIDRGRSPVMFQIERLFD